MSRKPRGQGYYRRHGSGYVCPVCGTIYEGAFSRRDAEYCCHDKKPVSQIALRAAEEILEQSYHVPTPRTKQPGDGEKWRDKWGHWRRGKKKEKRPQLRADYNKTFEKIAREMEAERLAELDDIFYSLDDTVKDWLTTFHKSTDSWDKKIAYAWNIRNYELMKSYVSEMIKEAVQARERYLRNNPDEADKEPSGEPVDLTIDLDALRDISNKRKGVDDGKRSD